MIASQVQILPLAGSVKFPVRDGQRGQRGLWSPQGWRAARPTDRVPGLRDQTMDAITLSIAAVVAAFCGSGARHLARRTRTRRNRRPHGAARRDRREAERRPGGTDRTAATGAGRDARTPGLANQAARRRLQRTDGEDGGDPEAPPRAPRRDRRGAEKPHQPFGAGGGAPGYLVEQAGAGRLRRDSAPGSGHRGAAAFGLCLPGGPEQRQGRRLPARAAQTRLGRSPSTPSSRWRVTRPCASPAIKTRGPGPGAPSAPMSSPTCATSPRSTSFPERPRNRPSCSCRRRPSTRSCTPTSAK